VMPEIISTLKKGGIIIYPTDTVYGIGANALNENAVEQVFKIKERSLGKPLPIIVKNMTWVKELVFVHPKLEPSLDQIWSLGNTRDKPGPVTVILPKKDVVPWIITSKKPNVAIRIPKFKFTDILLGRYGYPLIATSANISGLEPTGDIHRVIDMFKDRIWKPDLIIDAGNLPKSQPSTILDLTTIKPRVIRTGSVNPKILMGILGF